MSAPVLRDAARVVIDTRRPPRVPTRGTAVTLAQVFKDHRADLCQAVGVEGVEPSSAVSETASRPSLTPSSALGGNRTHRRPGKSRLLDLQATSAHVGRLGIEPEPFRVKAGCSALELTSPLALLWTGAFHLRHSFRPRRPSRTAPPEGNGVTTRRGCPAADRLGFGR